MRFVFAGDRDIATWVLQYILDQGYKPEALLVASPTRASHAEELIALCPFLGTEKILVGTQFRKPENLMLLQELDVDYIISIHFPYIIPKNVLLLPHIGVLNLHPAYLPYNRGWHTPSWAILEGTPIGATLHFMDEGIDTGDIIYQETLDILNHDTANTLYKRLKKLEFTVFKKAWTELIAGTYRRQRQSHLKGTFHKKEDLYQEDVQRINLEKTENIGYLIRRLQALTTNRLDEAAYFEMNNIRYRIQISIEPEIIDSP